MEDTLPGLADLDAEVAPTGPFQVTLEQYLADRDGKIRGTANPSIMEKPYWKYMIARGRDAYSARNLFEGRERKDNFKAPVWCFHRSGATVTVLPDGRHVYIAGEHEDSYDPDFCIYNDVVVLEDLPSLDLKWPTSNVPKDNMEDGFCFKPLLSDIRRELA
ncbi:MAG: hypothetical protein MMC33_002030 [Icmadophila ericetorum]|nr:hypothetical protein [Icmadophila ericetorum]